MISAEIERFGAALSQLAHGPVLLDPRSSVASVLSDLRCGASVEPAKLVTLQRSATISNRTSVQFVGTGKSKRTAIVTAAGVALYDLEFQPYCFSTRLLAQTMDALASDATVESIVMIVDTPGGAVTGTVEAGDAVYATRKRKTVTAIVDPLCASAGFWIASQASFIVTVPSGEIGSIGVLTLHLDQSKLLENIGIRPTFIFAGAYKVEGNQLEPLGSAAKAFVQGEIDKTYAQFVSVVARGRNTSVSDVLQRYGQGRVFSASDALAAGMIDRIAVDPHDALSFVLRRQSLAAHSGQKFVLESTSARRQREAEARLRRIRLAALS